MPIGCASHGVRLSVCKNQPNVVHSEQAIASTTTQIAAAERRLSQTARPIIKASDANAVNHVTATSAFPSAHRQRQSELAPR